MYILLDIGGTNTRITSSDGQKFKSPKIIPTNLDFEKAMEELANISKNLTRGEKINAVVGGVKSLDATKKTLKPHPVFPLWVNKPLHQRLEQITKAPVFLENDTAMAGLGEAVYGPGKNYQIVAYITVSTGWGGIRIVDKKIDKSAFGFEVGFQIVDNSQYLEAIISGAAIKKKYGKEASEIKDKRVWDEMASWMAVGINNVIVFWSPQIIIFGGPLMSSIPLENIGFYLKEKIAFPYIPPLELSNLGDLNGLYGALAYLNSLHSGALKSLS